MVSLKPYKEEDMQRLLAYDLPTGQLRFTMLPSDWLGIHAEKRKTKYPVTIGYQDEPVGFFVLDPGDDKFNYTENKNALLLRSLSVNPKYQGKGIGETAMGELLTAYCKQLEEGCDEIVLGMNEDNKTAYRLYGRTGFLETGIYAGGPNGPQFIMSKKI